MAILIQVVNSQVPFLTKYPIKWLQPLGNCISLAKHQKPTITGRLDIETIC